MPPTDGTGEVASPGEGGEESLPGKRKPSAFLGLGSSRYDGSHSEGNRFIADNLL
jgi:hypothetical protein